MPLRIATRIDMTKACGSIFKGSHYQKFIKLNFFNILFILASVMKGKLALIYMSCSLTVMVCKSQDYKFIYYLDANFSSVQKENATILGKGVAENSVFKLDCFSLNGDYHFLTAHFRDSSLSVLEGYFKSFYINGRVEKEGNYLNNAETGVWQQWDSIGGKTDSIVYVNGKEFVHATYEYCNSHRRCRYSIIDSLEDTYHEINYGEKDEIASEVFFKGKKGIVKNYIKSGIKIDSVFDREEKDAEFPGGDQAWSLYLQKNLNPDVPVNKKAGSGHYTVIIKFIVSPDGTLNEISAETNLGHGMEEEAMRVIRNSPKWIPARQYGRKVNAYRRQPVSFFVEAQ
jgi:antitoxin component YwqK of YwqJK toxin-antitoxin module